MPQGTVTSYDDKKGYGYIADDDGGPAVLVHYSAISGSFRTLEEGQKVKFDVRQGPQGPMATIVETL